MNLPRSTRFYFSLLFLSVILGLFFSGCSSGPPVKAQAYAKLKNERTFENDFATVWKATEEVLRNWKVKDRDPSEVNPIELRELKRRTLETDWIYGQSRDKYQEYQVNGFPRKTYLQTRFKYLLEAKTVMGGVNVEVKTKEEIERLKSDGSPAGYESADEKDTSRPSDLLDQINTAILAAPVI